MSLVAVTFNVWMAIVTTALVHCFDQEKFHSHGQVQFGTAYDAPQEHAVSEGVVCCTEGDLTCL